MNRGLLNCLCAISSMFILIGCARPKMTDAVEISTEYDSVGSCKDTLHVIADSILNIMTVEEKVGQLIMPALYARDDSFTIEKIKEYADSYHIGGIILLKGDIRSAKLISDTLTSLLTVAPFVAIDAEWGLNMRLDDAPRFMRNKSLATFADDSIMYDYGAEIARECRLIGINMVMGPVVDVADRGSVTYFRSFGKDAEKVGRLAVAYSRGLEDGGVVSVAKHFPGHGSVSKDSHKETPIIEKSLHELDSIDLYPYKLFIEADLTGIMVGHLSVPAIDPDALPATVSRVVISDLLRDDLGFKGLVLTDALNMGGAGGYDAADAFKAGADIILAPLNTSQAIKSILNLVKNDPDAKNSLDEKIRRILYHKLVMKVQLSGLEIETNQSDVGEGGVSDVPENLLPIKR